MEKLMTMADIQTALSVSRNTAQKLMREMNPVNIGAGSTVIMRVREKDFALWLQRRQEVQTDGGATTKKQRRKPAPNAVVDEFGRPLRKRNGMLVPVDKPYLAV